MSRITESFFWPIFGLIVLLLGLLPIFSTREPVLGLDYPCWNSFLFFFRENVFSDQQWFWNLYFPQIQGGYEVGNIYSAPIIVPWFFSSFVPPCLAIKLCILLAVTVAFFSMYSLAMEWGRSLPATAAGVSFVFVQSTLVNNGMWYNTVSISLALSFIKISHCCWKRSEIRRRDFTIMVALWVLSFYCHPLGAIMIAVFWLGIFSFSSWNKSQSFAGRDRIVLIVVPVLTALFAAPQIVAAVPVPAPSDVVSTNEVPSISYFSEIGYVYILAFWPIFLVAISFCRRYGLLLWSIFVIHAFFSLWQLRAYHYLPFKIPLSQTLDGFSNRGSYVQFALIIILFYMLLSCIYAKAGESREAEHKMNQWDRIVTGAGPVAFVVLLAGTLFLYSISIINKTLASGNGAQDFKDLRAYLTENTTYGEERLFCQTFETGMLYPTMEEVGFFEKWYRKRSWGGGTNIYSLLGPDIPAYLFGELWLTPFGAKRQYTAINTILGIVPEDLDETVLKTRMKRFNLGHLVVNGKRQCEILRSMHFLEEKTFGPFSVFSWPEFEPSWGFADGNVEMPVRCRLNASNHFTVMLDSLSPEMRTVTISFFYNPKWKAYSNETPLEVVPWNGLLQVTVPPDVANDIQLHYEVAKTPGFAGLLSGTVFFGFCLLLPHFWKQNDKTSSATENLHRT